jgi:hypothetical protein
MLRAADSGGGLQIRTEVVNVLNMQPTKIFCREMLACYETSQRASGVDEFFDTTKTMEVRTAEVARTSESCNLVTVD